jgi:hypothetical protein
MSLLGDPQAVITRLAEIENDLAIRQNLYEDVAGKWFVAQRDIKRAHATALLGSDEGTVTEKKAEADIAAATAPGSELEGEYEALKAVIRVLETRATIGMSILKAQGRA